MANEKRATGSGGDSRSSAASTSTAGEAGTKRFEEHLEELETIVRELETGALPLEDALGKYERGIRCLRECQVILERAEKKLEILLPAASPMAPGRAHAVDSGESAAAGDPSPGFDELLDRAIADGTVPRTAEDGTPKPGRGSRGMGRGGADPARAPDPDVGEVPF
jgi:exodeoxyribonuclease VII small subunit